MILEKWESLNRWKENYEDENFDAIFFFFYFLGTILTSGDCKGQFSTFFLRGGGVRNFFFIDFLFIFLFVSVEAKLFVF